MDVYLLTHLLDTHIVVKPPEPVEVVALVDGTMFRAAIEWPAIEEFLQADQVDHVDEAAVRDALYRNRHRIELAIKAHLFACGVPLARQLSISLDEFHLSGPGARSAPPSGARARANL